MHQLSMQLREKCEETELLIKQFGLPQAPIAVPDLLVCQILRKEVPDLRLKLENESMGLKVRAVAFQQKKLKDLTDQWKLAFDWQDKPLHQCAASVSSPINYRSSLALRSALGELADLRTERADDSLD
jgi:hypothetical protein